MKHRVHLLYFEGCPNVVFARENVRRALSRAGLPPLWAEIDLRSEACPPRWRGFPSPTVLADGADVVGGAVSCSGAGSCRFDGAPGAEKIVAALARRPRWAAAAALPAAAVGLLPAAFCPACSPALAGLLGALGFGAAAERALAPITAVLLAAAMAALVYQARRGGSYRPLAVGALGAVGVYAGQFLLGSDPVKFAGIVLLLAASFWNVLAQRREAEGCPACAEER